MKKEVTIEAKENIYWEDYGHNCLVFKKGKWYNATTHLDEHGEVESVTAETPYYEDVIDYLPEGKYEIVKGADE